MLARRLQFDHRLEERNHAGILQPMHGDAAEREAADVHFLDRPARRLQEVDRRLGDELEPRRPQLLEERTQGHRFASGQLLQIRQRIS